jgi:hypothetical protein
MFFFGFDKNSFAEIGKTLIILDIYQKVLLVSLSGFHITVFFGVFFYWIDKKIHEIFFGVFFIDMYCLFF